MNSSPHRLAHVLADNFRWACQRHVCALLRRAGPSVPPSLRDRADRFLAGAAAAAPLLCAAEAGLGIRIDAAASAMREAVGNDDHLGIVLLCAPIAAAAWRADGAAAAPSMRRPIGPEASLRAALQEVLIDFDDADTEATFRAITRADPAWLGSATDPDTGDVATLDLRGAMAMAAPRDRIALQYITDFDDLFDPASQEFVGALGEPPAGDRMDAAMEDVFFGFLARFADAQIFRAHGRAAAQGVVQRAREWRRTWGTARDAAEADLDRRISRAHALERWEADLAASGIRPGTSADLSVATAFLAACLDHRLRALDAAPQYA